jgi:hypothetical protein
VPLEELDLRRLREAAEEMREQLGVTSKAVSTGADLGMSIVGMFLLRSGHVQQQVSLQCKRLGLPRTERVHHLQMMSATF